MTKSFDEQIEVLERRMRKGVDADFEWQPTPTFRSDFLEDKRGGTTARKILYGGIALGVIGAIAGIGYHGWKKGWFQGKDKTPPEMSINYQLTASDAEDLFPDDLAVRYETNEPVKDVEMTISPVEKPKEKETFKPQGDSFTVPNIAPGKYYVRVDAKDLAGNPTMRDKIIDVKIPEEYEDLIAAYSVDQAKTWKKTDKLSMIRAPEIAKYWQSGAPGNVTFAKTLVDGSSSLDSALKTAEQVEQNFLDRYWKTEEFRNPQSYHPDEYHINKNFKFAKFASEYLSPEELTTLIKINERYGWHDVNVVDAQVNGLDLNNPLHRRFLEYRIQSTASKDNDGTRLDDLSVFDAFINQPFKDNDRKSTDRGDLAFDTWSALVRDGYESQLQEHPKLFESAIAVRAPFADVGDKYLEERYLMSYDDLRKDAVDDLKYMFDHEDKVKLDGKPINLENYSFDVLQYLTHPGRYNDGKGSITQHVFNNQEYNKQLFDVCQKYYPDLFNTSSVYDLVYSWLPADTPFGLLRNIKGPDDDVNKRIVLKKWISGIQKLALGQPLNETDGIYGACEVRSGAVGTLLRALLYPSRDVVFENTREQSGHVEYYVFLNGDWVGNDYPSKHPDYTDKIYIIKPYRANPNAPSYMFAYALKGVLPGVV